MADGVAISPGVGTRISTEEIDDLNGSPVPSQHVQRIALVLITADGTAVDLGDANSLPVQAEPVVVADAWDDDSRVTHDRRWGSAAEYLADPDGGQGWTTTWDGDNFVSEVPDA